MEILTLQPVCEKKLRDVIFMVAARRKCQTPEKVVATSTNL